MKEHPYKEKPTFKDMMNDVVEYGSCCECGSCVLVCPHNVIEYIDGKPKQTAKATAPFDYCGISEGIGCDVCAQVCPRLAPREFQLPSSVFGGQEGRLYRGGFGTYQEIYAARAKDPRILEVCQDGGVVTALLVHLMQTGRIDGAIVSAPDPERPCAPRPICATTVDEIVEAAGSWYTYVPNDLALQQAVDKDCQRVAFVGVPCQVTPVRKAELRDTGFIRTDTKRDKIIDRQTKSLKDPVSRIAVRIGLLCSEVFDFEGLMVRKIEGELGIPLTDVKKFNVKGEVLVYRKDGELVKINLREAQEHARPECHHCGDFSAELADISCGGVGSMDWTITITRTDLGRRVMQDMIDAGLLEVRPIEDFENSLKVLLRLARRQHQRVPVGPGGLPAVRPSYYRPSPDGAGS
ncbi:MAG TPA: Coenzyme F420 hydrogenase/dehydrogenase, beta subunit C-terminal domain [Candidatus Limnocylindrales bacterium]|nr:Coenzyme F420 hydrogenase/dehydrogenase, beta subunit C-terminal domain [Candidatus Limnocylindrales bacterium]